MADDAAIVEQMRQMADALLSRLGPGWTAMDHPNCVGVCLYREKGDRKVDVFASTDDGYSIDVTTTLWCPSIEDTATVIRALTGEARRD